MDGPPTSLGYLRLHLPTGTRGNGLESETMEKV